jgi:hypothetical protein
VGLCDFFGITSKAIWAALAAPIVLVALVTIVGLASCLVGIYKGEDVEWEFRIRSLAIRWKITGSSDNDGSG